MINKEKLIKEASRLWEKQGIDTVDGWYGGTRIKDMIEGLIDELIEIGCSRNEIVYYFNHHGTPQHYVRGCMFG
jgi:hypothetical protein